MAIKEGIHAWYMIEDQGSKSVLLKCHPIDHTKIGELVGVK